ncbi:hypothetical protein [Trichococcus pasteurii]|uniref:Uncharacterized protein n=1 Tax=Trichococcus pasteurii TaxID=43064 RepID=A0A1W1IIB6_9LACT|nr:hypothetical protein [Trichococcus pasteurii]SFF09241.1 hypothetical protein SAMN04488086_12616 [Trichococcus pasteurii]SLM52750.1 Hypothetical protein TPAS_2457 [Trichococcus pasteurii]SSB93631.1 Hypothetical protein TPAS_2457 [Trichococcus pasteurii]
MIRNIFSIPVHEKPEVVIDQIMNYKYYNQGCGIVLHLSKNFQYTGSQYNENTFFEVLEHLDNVFINPRHVRTGFGDIIQAHLSNFEYVCSVTDFEYFSLGASNDLFIKEGLNDFMVEWKAGLKIIPVDIDVTWMAAYKAKSDTDLLNMLASLNGTVNDIKRSQVEGAFFDKKLFSQIANIVNNSYDFNDINENQLYAREEVYFPTIVQFLISDKEIYTDNYTYNATNSASWTIYLDDIDRIITSKNNYFCIKRISRDINNPIRSYVRDYLGEYTNKVQVYISGVKKISCEEIMLYEKKQKIIDSKGAIIEIFKKLIKKNKFIRDYIGKTKKKP